MSALCARVSASVTDIHSKLESRGQQNWMHFVKKNKIRRGGMPGKMPDRMSEYYICQIKIQIECKNVCQEICHGGDHTK